MRSMSLLQMLQSASVRWGCSRLHFSEQSFCSSANSEAQKDVAGRDIRSHFSDSLPFPKTTPTDVALGVHIIPKGMASSSLWPDRDVVRDTKILHSIQFLAGTFLQRAGRVRYLSRWPPAVVLAGAQPSSIGDVEAASDPRPLVSPPP
jgi:hypothetical protein